MRPWFDSRVWKIHWKRDRLPTPVFLGFPGGSAGRVCLQPGRPVFSPWVGKIPWRRERLPTQYSGLENSMDCPWGCKESDTTEQLSCARRSGWGRIGWGWWASSVLCCFHKVDFMSRTLAFCFLTYCSLSFSCSINLIVYGFSQTFVPNSAR